VKKYATEHKISYREALKKAGSTYKKTKQKNKHFLNELF
jgi:hypothetical protein